ncbi:MAG TPA: FAD-dependent oxidoreductase, partial [Polyangiaceae bacterium]|nr:FAD-dependent oxidoreductase [Polyangiaceae bacterium]
VLVERGALGGTCVNTGCTPTKTMIASARAAHVARTAGRLGVAVESVSVDFTKVRRRKDEMVTRWREGIERRLGLAGPNLELVHGHAKFVGPREVDVEGRRFSADVIVVNVGTRPSVPELPGLENVPWLDNHRVMALEALPERLVVLGGGYVGCEFSQMFRRLGSEVAILEHGEHLMHAEDEAVSREVEAVFSQEGIEVVPRARVENVTRTNGGVELRLAGGRDVVGSHLLVATGRRPNTDDLGCDAAGLELDARGFVVTNDHYETRVPGVFAVGDASGAPQFTHVAWDDHRILFEQLMGRQARARSSRSYPYVAFTDPEVAGVGLNEKRARAKGVVYELATIPFSKIARAAEVDEPAGVLRVLVDPKTETVLGASIVGAQAGELIHCFVVLMEAKASVRAIVDAEMAHPTFAEGVQSVLMALERYST